MHPARYTSRRPADRFAASLSTATVYLLIFLLWAMFEDPIRPGDQPNQQSLKLFDITLPQHRLLRRKPPPPPPSQQFVRVDPGGSKSPSKSRTPITRRAASMLDATPRMTAPPQPRTMIGSAGPGTIAPPRTFVVDSGLPALGNARFGNGANGDGEGRGHGRGTGDGEGDGSGVQLYDPRWVVEPTHDQLVRFLPEGATRVNAVGAGSIACQVRLSRHVRNCRVLGESPQGSGFGTAAKNASYQFRVYPPTTDGRELDDAWVRIVITYDMSFKIEK